MASKSNAEYPMESIPGGEVELRDDRIDRKWTAEVRPFLLGRFPVTQGLYAAIVGGGAGEDDRRPVVNVSWKDAVAFCNRMSREAGLEACYVISDDGDNVYYDCEADGYRLPTEAEWQYACKAGSTGYRYGELDEIAWYDGNSKGRIHDVGGKSPNAWGLYDMLGNAWEWCWDLYDERVYGPYRIFRGGSWAEGARGCGATCRRRSHPTFHIDDLGFRLARSVKPE